MGEIILDRPALINGNPYFCIMLQQILIGILFLGALAYVGRLIYRSFQAKAACSTGCGKCNAVDFDKIEKQIQLKALKGK
jgi:hypothetical protein